jgi:hypothetical protein
MCEALDFILSTEKQKKEVEKRGEEGWRKRRQVTNLEKILQKIRKNFYK